MRIVQYVTWLIGVGLEVMLIASLLRNAWRQFPFIFGYSVTLLLTTVAEMAAGTGGLHDLARQLYWIDEVVVQVLLFCVVIGLIYRALGKARNAGQVRRWLIPGAFLFFAASLGAHYGKGNLNSWMTVLSRDLSFGSAVLDLLLWFILIAQPKKDTVLLLLSGGLGIQFTGAAIGQSLRQLSPHTEVLGDLILVFSDLICLYVWWQTFRREGRARAAAE